MEITHIPLGGQLIPLSIRRHRAARRISLRLSPARDGIVMTLPVRASVRSGMDFLQSKSGWVLAHIETDKSVGFADGAAIPLLGNDYIIHRMDGRGVSHLNENELMVFCAPEFISRRVRDFIKKQLQQACLTYATEAAAAIGKTVRDVKVRDTRSRWGSCSRDGTLTFHWQLAFAPLPVLHYLVAHEVAHLKEMNHSDKFWRIVAQLYPDYQNPRNWLKQHGHKLHRYGK